jgi:DNA adenine methylase
MKYLGSKRKFKKYILPLLIDECYKKNIYIWVEPFVGGANLIEDVPDDFIKIGTDLNPHTISALIGIRDYANILPTSISEVEYKKLIGKIPDPVTSWIRFVAAFASKFEDSYAKSKNSNEETYLTRGKKNALKQCEKIKNVKFYTCDYSSHSNLKNCLIYCDPPYKNTTKYNKNKFDYDKFWHWCREMSLNNSVFISELEAPNDFKCIWETITASNFSSSRKTLHKQRIEKLFTKI